MVNNNILTSLSKMLKKCVDIRLCFKCKKYTVHRGEIETSGVKLKGKITP